ncbi:peptidase S41 [Shewanella algae]|uniref:S41 family peptidase n=1 Tax=Shewanella algae TaxID=38313 RepID=UPI001AAD7577|nr:S41 family peptidase [Shewanella algae]MBO2568245.1 peptidase S41 [Shewanella algae]
MKPGFREVVSCFILLLLISSLQLGRFLLPEPPKKEQLSQRQMKADLTVLLKQLQQHSAFMVLDPDIESRLEKRLQRLKQEYRDSIAINRFTAEVNKLLGELKDPGIRLSQAALPSGVLPLRLRPMEDKWLALNDRDEPLQSDTPFISHIDGLPISHWQKIANRFLPPEQQNSVQMQMPWLQQLDLLRREMGLRVKEEVLLTLYGADLQPQNIEMKVPLQFRSAPLSILASWQQLAPDTALFSLTDLNAIETDPQLQQDLLRAMSNHTLVLDLRHARGFSDSLLQFLGNYHNGLSSQPLGYGRYRRSPQLRRDFLRPLHFEPLAQFAPFPPVRAALDNQPQPSLSNWYARPIPKLAAAPVPDSGRLVLLIGPDCRQECEWIAYAAKRWRRALLVGEPTRGDLGRLHHFTLPASGLQLSISASLGYDGYGQLLSGIGTEPDLQLPTDEPLQWQGLLSLISPEQSLQHSAEGQSENTQAKDTQAESTQVEDHQSEKDQQ